MPDLARVLVLLALSQSAAMYDRGFQRNQGLMRNTSSWLPGFCGVAGPGEGDCTSGAKGVWSMPSQPSLAWAKRKCMQKCRGCARCNYVSVADREVCSAAL